MDLLLVTTCWPYRGVPEFLDDEIHHLARRFGRIVVAPMRPRGERGTGLPPGVEVELELAQHLQRASPLPSSRQLTALVRAGRPASVRSGIDRSQFAKDARHPTWLRTAVINRADANSVAAWAKRRPAPALGYTFWLGAATAGLRAGWPHMPLVSRVHGGDLFAEAHGWSSIPYQAAAIRSVDILASVSECGRSYLEDKFPEAVARTHVRKLGISDLGAWQPRTRRDDSINMLSVSSIDDNKRVLWIAELARELACHRPVRWTHLGDGPLRGRVELALAKSPANLQVQLRGQVGSATVRSELLAGGHDVFVNLSLSEGAPVSLMEAQCCGIPVVATAVGGTPEVVPGALNELVGAGATLDDLAKAVLRAVARPIDQAQRRRHHWAANYDADTNYGAWAGELARLVGAAS